MRSLYERYVRPYAASYGLIIVGCLALYAIRPSENNEDAWTRYAAAKGKAIARDNKRLSDDSTRLQHANDSLTVALLRRNVQYVRDRRNALDAVAALPSVAIAGDTVTIGGIPH